MNTTFWAALLIPAGATSGAAVVLLSKKKKKASEWVTFKNTNYRGTTPLEGCQYISLQCKRPVQFMRRRDEGLPYPATHGKLLSLLTLTVAQTGPAPSRCSVTPTGWWRKCALLNWATTAYIFNACIALLTYCVYFRLSKGCAFVPRCTGLQFCLYQLAGLSFWLAQLLWAPPPFIALWIHLKRKSSGLQITPAEKSATPGAPEAENLDLWVV